MATGLAETCFQPAVSCHNCERKLSSFFQETKTDYNEKTDITSSKAKIEKNDKKKEEKEITDSCKGKAEVEDRKTKNKKKDFIKDDALSKKVYSRCGGCWLMSYCDQTCQLEHWNQVHKYHCAYLSGKKIVDDHKEKTCTECMESKLADKEELFSIDSPKIGCKINDESKGMRRCLGRLFGFHEISDAHNCSIEYACHSFPMGKISEKHVCTALDEMMVHASKLSNALIIKSINDKRIEKETVDELLELHRRIIMSRIILWRAILVSGSTLKVDDKIKETLGNLAQNLNKKFMGDHVWWRALAFSLNFIVCASAAQNWSRRDSKRLTDPKLLELVNYYKFQIKNVILVSENKLWNRFKFWPRLVNQSLVLVLPDDVSCVTCNADLSDQVFIAVHNDDKINAGVPHCVLYPYVSKDGGFAVTCPPAKNIKCMKEFFANAKDTHMIQHSLTDESLKPLATARMCQLCLRQSSCSHRCADCLAVQYCSMNCALKDMDFHKTVCSTWAKDPTRKIMSAKKQMEKCPPMIDERDQDPTKKK